MHLTLLVPGLLPEWSARLAPPPRAPALRRLLARGRWEAGTEPLDAELFRRFGWQGGSEPPVAAVSAAADGLDACTGWWLRADPVHLHADLHGVTLHPLDAAPPTPEEAEALASAFDRTYADEGLHLLTPAAGRWYLRLEAPVELSTTPLDAASGRDIHRLLPRGRDAAVWNGRMTEVQMLFYGEAVNIARESRHLPIVSGLWLWGGGAWPQRGLRAPAAGVYAAAPVARGLARAAGLALNPLPRGFDDWQRAAAGERSALVVLDALQPAAAAGDAGAWEAAVGALERDWFAPLTAALRRRTLRALTLASCGAGTLELRAGELWRFWRRAPAASRFAG
ncbi:hypothetical protein EV699_106190 [Plasticicumulans lactativorans]|uniref:Phosphoglycerate mutase n=1 Tax=Plasticicumulans lactativorans TaxID=1133106 RepID=A0A4R2L9Q6_9GAMM|nr:hypothetical protein [Plasticicumulans lactativorans]TCO82093.1 hypothetical protein EV699_106190 [Plasticicumulans lactativorans]